MSSSVTRRVPWWQRRGPSGVVFGVLLVAMVVISVVLWVNVSEVLPDLGKDRQGADPWVDPVGVERVGEFQIARIPDCAVAPVERIELWDEDSRPYWQVAGEPTPMASFAVGIAPEGFTEVTPFEEPPADAMLRLIVVRSVKGVAGVRYQVADLRTGYVASGEPIRRYGIEDFQTGEVCGDDGEGEPGDATTTSVPGG